MKLKICHLYPDVLNLYGDRGNILCLRKRLEWRGIDCIIDEKNIGDPVDFSAYDFFWKTAERKRKTGKRPLRMGFLSCVSAGAISCWGILMRLRTAGTVNIWAPLIFIQSDPMTV